MLKAVIFDDEYIVLQGLQRMIDWSKYGIELVGTATNGNEALTLFEAEQPDIIFSDIRMPGMDGLQVLEKILATSPDTLCIVFSGFNDFEYVKKALKLGVVDYLEKPITIPIIEDAINRIIEKINLQKSITSIQSRWEDSRVELLEKATLDLLLLGEEAIPRWQESFGIESEKVVGVTVLALSRKYLFLQSHSSYKVVPVRNGIEHLLVVFHFQVEMEALYEQLVSCPETPRIAIGSGRKYKFLVDAKKSYKEALQALRYGQFMYEAGWTRFEVIGENPLKSINLSDQEEAIIFSMRTGDKVGLINQLDSFIKQLEGQLFSPEILEREILKIIYLGMEVAKEVRKDKLKINDADFLPHVEIRTINSKEKMYNWFRAQMETIMNWSLEVRQEIKHGAVEKACKFMKENYYRDLTLQEVSDFVGMNSTYFSLLFKEEMEQSYIKYLTQIRMDQAKELLKEGQKVGEVSAKVGYHSYRHFSELFKKYVGVKPGQFRDFF
ncbi:response regulator [Bacillus sp. AFS037270]|uniref:response regulator n=1 Tax=Bacillus sp. AFS037270 TaxID=2033499 RepID=UPI000BFDCAF3|nr:response regulator [Bacillus sp. AFS037270]PGV49393.1 DNA-binding response regulator [Bacillus sp. AFS037270]